jgi:hypothetical protein
MDLRFLGLIACAAVAAVIVARILWLFANRVPVLARSENMDSLGDTLASDPLNPPQHPQGTERFSPFHEGDMRVDYQVGGKRYEHDIVTHSVDGLEMTAPDDMPILWADPQNPARTEARGPGFWVVMLLLVGAAAAALQQVAH